jgi:hypothetical protein|tara:strand:+ start:124 stop:348 length:225 start_codon:yes stop_codon:yes gene_type:complete
MLINIIYHTDFNVEAYSLKEAIKDRWTDMNVNMIKIVDHIGGAKYQVQLGKSIVSRSDSPVDNTTVINLIEERL